MSELEALIEIAERWATMTDKTGACIDLAHCRLIGNGIRTLTAQLEEVRKGRAAFVLVPREPTRAMLAAGRDAAFERTSLGQLHAYRAMIAAAPLPDAPVTV